MRTAWLGLSVFYTAVIVYGSLVPFDYTPLSVAEAWERWQHLQRFVFYSRAVWLTHSLRFALLAFLWSGVWSASSRLRRVLIGTVVCSACVGGAVALEFAQLYIPSRTVTQNDIEAGAVGAMLGVLAWWSVGAACLRRVYHLTHNVQVALRAFFVLYGLCYGAVALFPYDFVLSIEECRTLLAYRPFATFLLGTNSAEGLRYGISLVLEGLAMIPLGAVFAPSSVQSRRVGGVSLCAIGAALGLVVEGGDVLRYSGNVALLSLVTRGCGLLVGCRVAELCKTIPRRPMLQALGPLARWLIWPYLLMLLVGSDRVMTAPLSLHAVITELKILRFFPFAAYHLSPTTLSLRDCVWTALLSLPFGLLYRAAGAALPTAQRWLLAGGVSVVTVSLLGIGRFFFQSVVDPDTLLVSFGAALAGYCFGGSIRHLKRQPAVALSTATPPRTTPASTGRASGLIPRWQRVLACVLVMLLGLWLSQYSWPTTAWGLGLAGYGLLLGRSPWLWLLVLPAVLPVLDGGNPTGWLVGDALDMLLLTTMAVSLWRTPLRLPPHATLGLGGPLVSFWLLSVLCSALRSMLTEAPHHAEALLGYGGPLHGWWAFKAWIWPWLFLPGLRALHAQEPGLTLRRVALGTGVGLLSASVTVWGERAMFTGLWAVDAASRAVGSFPGVHTGGAAWEAYLVMSLPFLSWACLVPQPRWRLLASGVAVVAGYALLVTFSYTAYLAALGACGVLLLGWPLSARPASPRPYGALRRVAGGLLLLLVGSLLVYSPERLQPVRPMSGDAATRWAYWAHILSLRPPDLLSQLVGAGLGRYPALQLTALPDERRPGSALLVAEEGNTFLRLRGGTTAYIAQSIAVQPQERYWLLLDVRTFSSPTAQLGVLVCEKHAIHIGTCVSQEFAIAPAETWRRQNLPVDLASVGRPRTVFGWQAPRSLLLMTPEWGQTLEVDNVHLLDSRGRDLLTNGDFAQGGLKWHISHDDTPIWHIQHFWVALLFEHGLLGLVTFILLLLYVSIRLGVAIRRGHQYAVIFSASMLAFLVIGLTDSIIDAPRPTMFLGVLCMLALVATPRVRVGRAPHTSRPLLDTL